MDAKDRSEVIKNYMQIVAIVIAGIWTASVFYQKDKPALQFRVDGKGDVQWEQGQTSDACRAVFDVAFQNIGTTSFDIEKVRIRAWRFSKPPKKENDSAIYYDFNPYLVKENLITDRTYLTAAKSSQADVVLPLVGRYPSGVGYNHSFEWEVRRDPGQMIFFRTDLYRKADETETPWYFGGWSPICAGVDLKKTSDGTEDRKGRRLKY
jgi:hypothetical protein